MRTKPSCAVVLNCSNLERSVRFYTEILGFKISDVYGDDMMEGGMVFMRFNADHHGIALVGTMEGPSPNVELNHLAFEVASGLIQIMLVVALVVIVFRLISGRRVV